MSDEEEAGAERGLVQQEVVVGVENKIGKEPGLVDTQKQVDFACWSVSMRPDSFPILFYTPMTTSCCTSPLSAPASSSSDITPS